MQKAKAKKRPAETPSKTPPVKKAKVEISSPVNNKTGKKPLFDSKFVPLAILFHGREPHSFMSFGAGSGTAKKSGHIHVATPYPSKQVKKRNRQ